jgi:hypothetical protein
MRDWNQHFRGWLDDVFIKGLLDLYEYDKIPDTFHLHPQKLKLAITTPEGEMMEDLAQLHSVMSRYDSDKHNLIITVESIYVREVGNRPEPHDEFDTWHIGHAVLEYRFVAQDHNNTGTLVVTARHPNICVWGR